MGTIKGQVALGVVGIKMELHVMLTSDIPQGLGVDSKENQT